MNAMSVIDRGRVMIERPSLAELTAFLAIVRHQSFRAAAEGGDFADAARAAVEAGDGAQRVDRQVRFLRGFFQIRDTAVIVFLGEIAAAEVIGHRMIGALSEECDQVVLD